jgi:hypothetical protein
MPAAVRHLDKTGEGVITGKTWPDIIVGGAPASGTPEKFAVQNSGDRELVGVVVEILASGLSDGVNQLRIGQDTQTVIPPYAVVATLSGTGAGGVWPSTGVRGYRLTAFNALGDTVGSLEVTVNVDEVSKTVALTWLNAPASSGSRVYRTETPGAYPAPALRAELALGAVSYVDIGSAAVSGTIPPANTTAGPGPNYGTSPVLSGASLVVGTFKIGQQFVYWVNRVVPGATAEAGNPRVALINVKET